MQEIIPFQNTEEALRALDNGGRFYHLFTKANDGIITTPELGKVAGLYTGKQQMSVYLAMSVAGLNPVGQEQVIYSLSPELKNAFEQYVPLCIPAGRAATDAKVSSSAIITGIPKQVDSSVDFKGFIIIPIISGSAMTMVMVPIMDRYDVYELRDEHSTGQFFIAHARGEKKLPETMLCVGGVIKELKAGRGENSSSVKFLEALYYSKA